jgi:tetratricopeptide (TPR) repeat protein
MVRTEKKQVNIEKFRRGKMTNTIKQATTKQATKQITKDKTKLGKLRQWVITAKTPQHFSVPVQQRLVQNLAAQGDFLSAIALLTQLIYQEPENPIHYNNRGLLYFRNGNHAQAIQDYNHALELNPHLDSAYNNRANYHAVRREYWQAIADYETTLELNPLNSRAWINLGITYRDLGVYGLAKENFDTALLFRQLEGKIYAERGRTHHLDGDWNLAIADYQKALTYLSLENLDRPRRQVEQWIQQLLAPQTA